VSVSGGPPALVGLSYTEGYLCDWSLSSWGCGGGIPSASDIEKAVSGICAGPDLIVLTRMSVGALCKDISGTNWNLTSSVSTFYAGIAFGGGGSISGTIPLSWFGVSPNPRESWKWVIDVRQQYGWTWDKISAEWFR
jgi:hypothetical protein